LSGDCGVKTMSEKAPRRFFQLHLSTALVLMVLAAVLLGANLIPRSTLFSNMHYETRGWPWALDIAFNYELLYPGDSTSGNIFTLFDGLEEVKIIRDNWYTHLIGNIAIALAILTPAAVLLEWRLRRKTDPKEEAAHG